jgi:hypothetical protein
MPAAAIVPASNNAIRDPRFTTTSVAA